MISFSAKKKNCNQAFIIKTMRLEYKRSIQSSFMFTGSYAHWFT